MEKKITTAAISLHAIAALALFTSCVATSEPTSELAARFREAVAQERSLSAICLKDRQKGNEVLYGMDQQNAAIAINLAAGGLIKSIDLETQGSPEKQRALLLHELHENGCMYFLQELNRYYHVLSKAELEAAASQSGKEPSELCVR